MNEMRENMRRVSKTSKKGCLERIYKQWTLPEMFKKSEECVICGGEAVCGHHLYGRITDFNHIHPSRVIPVCMECHRMEKSTDIKEVRTFNRICDIIKRTMNYATPSSEDKIEFVYEKLEEFGYQWR